MSKMLGGQSVSDRLNAAKHSITGQGLAKTVCKASTEEVMGPKKKHVDYLVGCTNEPNVSIPQLANLVIDRTKSGHWVIVYKALITTHNLMNFGNERYMQYLASNNCTFQLSNFTDRRDTQGYDMSTFIRRYAKYLNDKAASYRSMAFDFCKIKRGKEDGLLRQMSTEKLLKTLPQLQHLLDVLIEFDVTPNELTNGVINACFMLLFKDLIRLFACYNDGIINLLEKYFDMNKKQCKEALEVYKRFLSRMERVSDFFKVAENVGIDRGDIPDLAKAPASLLEALESHLASLEGRKYTPATTPTSSAQPPPASTNGSGGGAGGMSEAERRRVIDEEKKTLEKFKFTSNDHWVTKDQTSPTKVPRPTAAAAAAPAVTSPGVVAQPPPATNNPFAEPAGGGATSGDQPSADLLQLDGNPFIQNVQSVMAATAAQQQAQQAWQAQGVQQQQQGAGLQVDFARAFSQQPQLKTSTAGRAGGGFDAFGDVLTPQSSAPLAAGAASQPPPQLQGKPLVAGDLDSSLASLAGNLSLGRNPTYQQPRPMASWGQTSTTMQQPRMAGSTWGAPMMGQPMMGAPMMGAPQPYMAGGGGMMGGGGGMYGGGGGMMMRPQGQPAHTTAPPQQQQQQQQQDPFSLL